MFRLFLFLITVFILECYASSNKARPYECVDANIFFVHGSMNLFSSLQLTPGSRENFDCLEFYVKVKSCHLI